MDIIPANHFLFEELTAAYNQTRVDYLVPMPMNVSRLREYAHVYDVDLNCSCVAMQNGTIWGLGMLGLRGNCGWVTRLGVLPNGRRQGTGSAMLEWMINKSISHHNHQVWLEVIKGNAPGYELFVKFGFETTRELIVARRPPRPDNAPLNGRVKRITYLEHDDAIDLLNRRKQRPNWLNDTRSLQNVRTQPAQALASPSDIIQTARHISALMVELSNGGLGWVAYQATMLQLTRIVVEVVCGDPADVTAAVLLTLHQHHRRQDAIVENIPDDEQWLGYQQAGYFEAFRRIEMVRTLTD